MKWLLTPLAALFLFSAPAAAGSLSAKDLADGCRANTIDRVACLAYMEGFSDGFVRNDVIMTSFLKENVRSGHLAVAEKTARVEKPAYCADDEIPADMVREAYLDWAEAHPEDLDQPAASALFVALVEAFPCTGAPSAAEGYQSASLRP
jgi:hypothetical protein